MEKIKYDLREPLDKLRSSVLELEENAKRFRAHDNLQGAEYYLSQADLMREMISEIESGTFYRN